MITDNKDLVLRSSIDDTDSVPVPVSASMPRTLYDDLPYSSDV